MYTYPLRTYLQETFGEPIYKLALDGGMTCPNRDGRCGTRGCIFCSAGGSGDFAEPFPEQPDLSLRETIWEQIERAKRRVSAKTKATRFIAYFQNYTNTYAPVERLASLFSAAISHPDIAALSIATRPDCITPENATLLHRLNTEKPVWVELGLQTIHPRTAAYIRRGYPLSDFEEAMRLLQGLHTVVHVILGLPGESHADQEGTVRYVAKSGAGGIKLQLLHVLRGTDLEAEYLAGRVPVMELEEYADFVTDLIELLPPKMVLHRLTGDGPKRLLIAPLWSAQKKVVLNAIQQNLLKKGICQGRLFHTASVFSDSAKNPENPSFP